MAFLIHRLMSRTTGPKTVRTVTEILFIDRLQQHKHRSLQKFVFERRNSNRASFAAGAFRNLNPTHGWCAASPRMDTIQQRLQIGRQTCFVVPAGCNSSLAVLLPDIAAILLCERPPRDTQSAGRYFDYPRYFAPACSLESPELLAHRPSPANPDWLASRRPCFETSGGSPRYVRLDLSDTVDHCGLGRLSFASDGCCRETPTGQWGRRHPAMPSPVPTEIRPLSSVHPSTSPPPGGNTDR
jgi:hypothetical protein